LSLSNDLNRAKAATGIEGLDAILDGALSHEWQMDDIP